MKIIKGKNSKGRTIIQLGFEKGKLMKYASEIPKERFFEMYEFGKSHVRAGHWVIEKESIDNAVFCLVEIMGLDVYGDIPEYNETEENIIN